MNFPMTLVGVAASGRAEPTDDDRGAIRSTIHLDAARFAPTALAGYW
jgi:hypothetical protein